MVPCEVSICRSNSPEGEWVDKKRWLRYRMCATEINREHGPDCCLCLNVLVLHVFEVSLEQVIHLSGPKLCIFFTEFSPTVMEASGAI